MFKKLIHTMATSENHTFIGSSVKVEQPQRGCCRSPHTRNCCIATAVFGVIFVILGIVIIAIGQGVLEGMIQDSMALEEGSDRMESWLRPPVQPHLNGYVFHIKNPEAVLAGKKPILEEKGPYVYRSTTVKDSNDNIVRHDDGTFTYRPRKLYHYEPSLSGPGLDPFKDYVTVPNIPLWTALNSQKRASQLARDFVRSTVSGNGLKTPFINVTFNGLLWGYQDDLPCLKLDKPGNCPDDTPFGSTSEDDWGDDDDDWGSDWDRKKRSVSLEDDPDSAIYGKAPPKAEYVNCSCEWGLFRDRNITMRKPLRIFSGEMDLTLKGVVKEYDGSAELGWWQKGSLCDTVKGQDSSTLPPSLTKEHVLDIYIALMCRTIKMTYEKVKNILILNL